jgi:hypothetical protein
MLTAEAHVMVTSEHFSSASLLEKQRHFELIAGLGIILDLSDSS